MGCQGPPRSEPCVGRQWSLGNGGLVVLNDGFSQYTHYLPAYIHIHMIHVHSAVSSKELTMYTLLTAPIYNVRT